MRRLIILYIISIFIFFVADNLSAVDTPHNKVWTTNSDKQVGCGNCHVPRATASSGPSLTKVVTNAGLCLICHVSGSSAAGNLSFDVDDQADQENKKGWSHRWDRDMRAGVAPLNLVSGDYNNKYGLRTYEDLPSSSIKNMHLKFGGAPCSTCHRQHFQSITPWDPAGGVDSGTATAGSTTTITQTGKTWTANQWQNFYVRITSGTTNKGKIRKIQSNTNDTLTIYSSGTADAEKPFPVAISSEGYIIVSAKNHFQRMETSANQMCEYCHYYRTPNSAPGGVPQTDVRTWDGNKKSHPIGKIFSSAQGETPSTGLDTTQFNTAPLEPISVFDAGGDIVAQTDSVGSYRYKNNGTGDNNSTNNIILDANGRVRCMSCHGVHYKDSDSSTVDGP